MKADVHTFPSSREALAVEDLLKGCLEHLPDFDPACAAIVLVSKDGTIRHHINFGSSPLALLGGAETLKQYIYRSAFTETS